MALVTMRLVLGALAAAAALTVLPHCAADAGADADVTDDAAAFATLAPPSDADDEPAEPTEDDPGLSDPGVSTCDAKKAACPAKSGLKDDAGLKSVELCSFHLGDKSTWDAQAALVDRLAKSLSVVKVGDVLADANRDAREIDHLYKVDDFAQGFQWKLEDNASLQWWPQGITGSGDASATGMVDGKRVLAVTFYDKGDTKDRKGVRVAFADITNPKDVKYRFALLVNPKDAGDHVDFDPVTVHAGGVVWYGKYLYVPATGSGFKVFDMSHILRTPDQGASVGWNANGKYSAADYRYVIPQVGEYKLSGSCPAVFSFAALDRSTTPHSIVTGEYTSGNEGRVFRWSLDEETGRLAAPYYPTEVYFAQQTRIQGGISWQGKWWVQSAAQTLLDGKLYRVAEGTKSKGTNRPPGIEDLYHDPSTGLLWSVSEYPGLRYVFASPIDKL